MTMELAQHFGSTGCGQLISVSEKKEFIDSLSKMKFKEQILIGPSCNSLRETINIMNYAVQKGIKNFLSNESCLL